MTELEDLGVVACSLCLNVLRDGAWVEAEEAIRERRTYESPVPVPLEAGVCDECSDRVRARRARPVSSATGVRRASRRAATVGS